MARLAGLRRQLFPPPMRLRTYLGVLVAFGGVVVASYLTHANRELLQVPFTLWPGRTLPLWGAFLLVFVAGFVPAATTLVVQRLKRELAARRERQRSREVTSLRGSLRRALDLVADTQWTRAAAELETLLAETPDDFVALLHHGVALREAGRPAEALEVHRRASLLYPQSVALLYAMAEDYEALGESAVATDIRSRVLRDLGGVGVAVLRRRRDRYLAADDFVEAAKLQARLDKLLEDTPGAGRPTRDVAVAQGLRYEEAVRVLEEERPEDALLVVRELIAADPRFIPAWILAGEAELVRGDEKAALAAWREGWAATANPVFLERLQDHLIESEQPERAIELAHRLVGAARERDLLPRFFLGRLYYRLEMLDEALRVLEGLGDRVQRSPLYHFLRGRIHERRGEMHRACAAYLTALRELGIDRSEYRCRVCGLTVADWADRCSACGTWGSFEFPLEEAAVPEELERREAAARRAFDDGFDDWQPPEPPR